MLLELFEPFLEHRAVRDDLALRGYPSAEPMPARAAREVFFGFFTRNAGGRATNSYLAFQIGPIKHQRRVWIFGQFPSFAALVIGEEDESAFIETFQQDNPRRKPALLIRGSQRHRCRLEQLGV